jgi:hypothetical protein
MQSLACLMEETTFAIFVNSLNIVNFKGILHIGNVLWHDAWKAE